MRYTGIYLLFPFFIFVSCKKNESLKNQYPDISNIEKQDLIKQAINNNDESAYITVSFYYGIWGKMDDFLKVSIDMANKNNCPRAYYDVYWILNNCNSYMDIEGLDEKTKCLALYYLLKSYELGFDDSKYVLNDLFKNELIPKSNYYLIKMANE